MSKTPSLALLLWLAAVVGCGASSEPDEPGSSTDSDRDGMNASVSGGARSAGSGSSAAGSSAADSDDSDAAEASGTDAEGVAEAAPDLSAPPDVAAPPPDASVTASGLASKVLEAGTGTRRPRATDRVRVNYSGWQTNGMLFDSSLRRGMPSEFPLDGVIRGWTEGLQLMVEGERRRFWIPEELAYRGSPDRPSGMLVFDVELIAILTP